MQIENFKDNNILISDLSAVQILTLAQDLKNTSLEYRNTLNLPSIVKFGLELEYEKVDKSEVDKIIKKQALDWKSDTDETLTSGGEIKSPRLTDNQRTWEDLRKICEFLKLNHADTCHNSGIHVHVGAHILGDNIHAWRKFAKIYTLYERVLIRFGYGDKANARSTLYNYARPIGYKLLESINLLDKKASLNDLKKFYKAIYDVKKNAINIRSMDFLKAIVNLNTIEFRNFNSSTEDIIVQNDINAACSLVNCATHDIDEDYLDYKLRRLANSTLNETAYLEECSQILLREMAELVDLLFNNTEDKLYFMRQYIKDFESCNDKELKIVRGLVK